MKTDDPKLIGVHCFERAKLGQAPFRCVGYFEAKWQAHPGAPVQAGTTCDYCGQGIMHAFRIQGADKSSFKVGSDCVLRTGDVGLIKGFKSTPEYRKAQRAKRAAKDDANIAEWQRMLSDPDTCDKLAAVSVEAFNGKESFLTYASRVWPNCGAAGRARYVRSAKRILKNGSLA